jgi:uncharacterized membrane protein YgdD (TMEM256/DUF423 family)
MNGRYVQLACALGFVAVAAGAFGAHALEARVAPEALAWWDTGARYLGLHTAPLFVVAAWAGRPWARRAGVAFVLGSAVFAGTLFAMTLGGPRWLGAITPVGGTLLLAGWALLGWAAAEGPAPRTASRPAGTTPDTAPPR